MAVLKKIRSRFFPEEEASEASELLPASPRQESARVASEANNAMRGVRRVGSREVDYRICPLTAAQLDEVWRLDQRCFVDGEAYSRDTFEYLLTAPECVSYRVVLEDGAMVGFIVGLVEPSATGHITTLGVAPEHRRRHIARRMMEKMEAGFLTRGCTSVRLEVRTVNLGAQKLYSQLGYTMTQRLPKYYSNGGDGLLMVKSII
jgi:ribosomal-protein-alanine acetyltransferase